MTRITIDDPRDYIDYRDGSGGTVEIFNVIVGSERRAGRGRQLVEELFKRVAPAFVWAITRANNAIAQQWYEALGFRVVGVLRGFYAAETVVDAVMYGRSSDGPI